MIVIENVEKAFDGRTILAGVSVTFARGKVAALVGPSGGGKSTLLRCINGLERFERGRIAIGDLALGPGAGRPDRAERAKLQAIRQRAGMVFQHYGLFAHMTALQNVMEAPLHVHRHAVKHCRERAMSLLERVGLDHRCHAFPRELSGGEQQRVAIARALAMEPEVLLLDEPTSALDPARKQEVVKVLRDFAEAGSTMVIVTHEAAVVRDIADHAVCLRDGNVIADGSPADVLADTF